MRWIYEEYEIYRSGLSNVHRDLHSLLLFRRSLVNNSWLSIFYMLNLLRFAREKKSIAERGFDPRTSGLWAQHASTAPLCYLQQASTGRWCWASDYQMMQKPKKDCCQKWDSNPRPQKWTATWTQRLRPLGHPDCMSSVTKLMDQCQWQMFLLYYLCMPVKYFQLWPLSSVG